VSTTGDKFSKPPLSSDIEDKYDPTKTQDLIDRIKKEREMALESKVDDRKIKIFNSQGSNQNRKSILFQID
jgi:hypothetical protein